MRHLSVKALALVCAASLPALPSFAAAKVKIVNADGPGEGFNDPTPLAPSGGNKGKTIGQQRLIAFGHAAKIWGATLPDIGDMQIRVFANFNPLTCSAAGVVLGSAGTITIWSDFPEAPFANTWYHSALANKLSGTDLSEGPKLDPKDPVFADGRINNDIRAQFNSRLGTDAACGASFWYYGLNTNTPVNGINLVAVLLHEFGHGLGFANFISEDTGAEIQGMDDIYSKFTKDNTTGLTWDVMTNAQRVAAAINTGNQVWIGPKAVAAVPDVLGGAPIVNVNSPTSATLPAGAAGFGAPVVAPGVTGALDLANDGVGVTTDGCTTLPAASGPGRLILIDRGTCTFVLKAKNAQDAGYAGVIIANNAAGAPPGLGGCDGTITIPVASITNTDGANLKMALAGGPVNVTLGAAAVTAGADASGNPLLFAPNPVQLGSSISHWDTSAYPNQLMEPAINCNLTHSVNVPQDMTMEQLRDIGWE